MAKKEKYFIKFTLEELFTLRDACMHGALANKDDLKRKEEYQALDRKLRSIIAAGMQSS